MIIELEKNFKNIDNQKKIDKTFEALERTMNVKFEEFGKRIKDLECSLKQKDLIISEKKQKKVNIQNNFENFIENVNKTNHHIKDIIEKGSSELHTEGEKFICKLCSFQQILQ